MVLPSCPLVETPMLDLTPMPIGAPLTGDLVPSLAPLLPDLSEIMPQGNPSGQSGIPDTSLGLFPQLTPTAESAPTPRALDPLTGVNNAGQPLAGQSAAGQSIAVPEASATPQAAAAPSGFIRRQGSQLVDGDGNPFTFQGIAFGNENWDGKPNPLNNDHSAIDFQRVKSMGMNSVRFYMNYKWFEDDRQPYQYKESAWRWLDKNIAWAKRNDISMILNMHVPQGGYQSQGEGQALWTKPENQNRLAALWQTIAERYKNETTIAGYGLVNEPIPRGSVKTWQTLAQKLANSIRQVDKNHLLFVESIIGIDKPAGVTFGGTADSNMIKIKDPNTVYEFHFYSPYKFTYQYFDWANTGDGGKYPDNDVVGNPYQLEWYTATFNNPSLNSGNTPWQYFEGEKYKVSDSKIKAGIATLVADKTGVNGTVAFDDVVIKEFNPAGQLTKMYPGFDTNSLEDWGFWSRNGAGSKGTTTAGRDDGAAITISSTTADGNLGNFENPILIKQGYSYQISGWMKGQNIGTDANAQLRIDFQTSDQPVYARNKEFLVSELQPFINWGKRNNVPLYIGEFGSGRPSFKGNKGGLTWVRDMLDIALQNKLSFNYHAYHEDSFGLYPGSGKYVDPATVNKPLRDLFITKLT
jgi:endoglucanase